MDITVRGDNNSFLTWDRLIGHDANSALLGWSGAGAGVLGSLLLGLGWYGSQDNVAIGQTNSYQGYVSFKTGAYAFAIGGVCSLIGATVIELIALNERSKYEAERDYMVKLGGK